MQQPIINLYQTTKEVESMPAGQISPNKTRVCILMPKDLKAEADKLANSDGRSLSGWVNKLVLNAVNEHNKSDTSIK